MGWIEWLGVCSFVGHTVTRLKVRSFANPPGFAQDDNAFFV